MTVVSRHLRRVSYIAFALLATTLSMPAAAQVSSQGRGQLTLMVGQGSGPIGGIASDVVNQSRTGPDSNMKHLGFRIVGGYQFADYASFEAGITHVGSFHSQASYLGTDQVQVATSFDAIEADVVGRVPFAPIARLDLTLGAVETGLNTSLSTASGSSLPAAQENPVNSKHFGVTVGIDLEVRLSNHTSLVAGLHAYPGVGSSRLIGSASGTVSLIGAGVHFEF